jgi:hypothetical protein
MGAPKTELRQHLVGIADKVPVGKEQELDQVERSRVPFTDVSRNHVVDGGCETYVSHVDIFLVFCYWGKVLYERIVR